CYRLWMQQRSQRGGCRRACVRNSGVRLSQPARRSASAVRGDQGPEGLASRERSGRLSGKNARYPKGFRASLFILVTPLLGLRVYCCVVEHCAGDEERCFRRSTDPSVIRVETMSIKPSYLLFTKDRKSTRLNSSHQIISYAV